MFHGWQSYLREHPKGQEITLGVPTLPPGKLDVPCNNLNFHTGEAAQMDDSHRTCEKAPWQYDLLLSFLLYSGVQETVGGTWLCLCGRSWSVLWQLCWPITGNLGTATHGFLSSFLLFLGYPGWRAGVIQSSCVWISVPLSPGSSQLGELLSKQQQCYVCCFYLFVCLFVLFFWSCHGFFHLFFIRLLLVRRLRAAIAQVRTAMGKCFQAMTKL